MLGLIIYFDSALLVWDLVTISSLRDFLLDFLRVKKSKNDAKRLYNMQTIRERITLSFIKENLERYVKEFTRFHWIYKAVLYTIIPQYIILIVCNILLEMKSMYVLSFFALLKLIVFLMVRVNIDANRVSKYRKNN